MYNHDCSACDLSAYVRKTGGHICIEADTLPESNFQGPVDVLIVGQNPGKTENRRGKPFVGDSSFIRGAFADGYTVAISNAVKCHSEENAEPTTTQIEACRPYLVSEIEKYRPKVIFALGNTALKALTGQSGVNKLRGQPHNFRPGIAKSLSTDSLSQTPILCSIHPAAVLRYPAEAGKLETDVEGVKRFLGGTNPTGDVEWVDARLEPSDFWYEGVDAWAFDLETSTAAYRDPRFEYYCIGMYNGAGPVKILTSESDFQAFHHVVSRSSIGFNSLGFDLAAINWRTWQSIDSRGDHLDVMLLAYLVDETMVPINLESCAVRWLGVPPWKDQGRSFLDPTTGLMRRPHGEDEWQQFKTYNARDVRYTYDLAWLLWNKLTPGQQRLYRHLLVPAAFSLTKMTENGVGLSLENLKLAQIETQAELDAAFKTVERIALDNWLFEFNPNSPDQVRVLLYDKLGLKPPKFTKKTKKPSTDQETLKILAQQEPAREACQALLAYKEPAKELSSYINKWLAEHVEGRLYPPYHLNRTETGRTSSPIQQVPRKTRIRRCIAAREGYQLVIADQSQIEVRLMAWRSKEPAMLETYQRDQDIHWRTALYVQRDETLRLAEMYRLRFGIPSNRTGSEVLRRLLEDPCAGIPPTEGVQSCGTDGPNQEPGSGKWGYAEYWTLAPNLETRWAKFLETLSEDELREVRRYQQNRWEEAKSSLSAHSPQGPQPQEQRPFEFRDAVQALSSARTRVLEEFPEWKEKRSLAKAVVFGTLYGAEAFTLQAYLFKEYGLKVTFETACWLRDEVFFGTFTELPNYYDSVIDALLKEKQVVSPFGRIRHLPNIAASAIEDRAHAARQAINTDNQADASDITLIGLNLALKMAPWLTPVMFVHDCNIFEVPNDRVSEAQEIVTEAMTTKTLEYIHNVFDVDLTVPLKVDVEVSSTWK